MTPGSLARSLDLALANASLATLDGMIGGGDRRAVLAATTEQGEALVASLYAPHTLETTVMLARLSEEQLARIDAAEADDLVAICCSLETTAALVAEASRYLADACLDLEAQRFLAWSKQDHRTAEEATRAGEVAEALTAGVRLAATRFALPVGRAGTVRTLIAARPDLYLR
jgi:hypothetical protein